MMAKACVSANGGQLSQLLGCEHLPDFKAKIGGLVLKLRPKIRDLILFGLDGSRVSILS